MQHKERLSVRQGGSLASSEAEAVRELRAAIYQPDAQLNVFYCSPSYDRERLAAALREAFGSQVLVGCTTAGEIGPTGYTSGGITGASLASDELSLICRRMDRVHDAQMSDGQNLSQSMLRSIDPQGKARDAGNLFGFLLIDGMSCKEELVVASLYRGLEEVQLFGGSAADGMNFGRTYVYHDGAFHNDACVFTLVKTTLPFVVFKTEHFVGGEGKMVVTAADPQRRIVMEMNGESAARAYAQAIGVTVEQLEPAVFAKNPVVVRVGGALYVRALTKVNPDESLTFACAIDEGIVLTVARSLDIEQNLRDAFRQVEHNIGKPKIVLGCDCILRGLELDQRSLRGSMGKIMADNLVCGFGTYGEQYNAMHINQTFTAVAIAEPAAAAE
jgi:hypothetical protein